MDFNRAPKDQHYSQFQWPYPCSYSIFLLEMPPKSSTKSENKAKAKIIEDKTFGLKNKNKSAKVGKYVQQVEKQVQSGGTAKGAKSVEDLARQKREQKKAEEAREAELAAMVKPVIQQQKVPFGVDPKTVLCAYFKAGQCSKGDKCKFSHDPNIDRKSAKINLYADAREEKEKDTMDSWDQDKLEEVVVKKHGPGIRTTTEIVCKYFLEAIENKKYGWFWECPNGGDSCKYRHALPPGFVLKSQMKKTAEADAAEQITLEEFLETERHAIKKITPVTAETFAAWKKARLTAQDADNKARALKRESEYKAGKLSGMVSGRDLFVYNPDLFKDDDEAMEVDYTNREEENNGENEEEIQIQDESLFQDLGDLELSDEEDCEDEGEDEGEDEDHFNTESSDSNSI